MESPQVALDVHVEARVPIALVHIIIQVEEIPDFRPALIRDHDIETAHDFYGLLDEADQRGALRNIGADGVEAGCFFRGGWGW